MIYTNEFIKELKSKLGLLYFNGGKTELVTYCPFCEGITGKSHGHLYISNKQPVFICHRCGKRGNILSLLVKIKSDISVEESVNFDLIDSYDESEINNSEVGNIDKLNYFDDSGINRTIFFNKLNFLRKRVGVSYYKLLSIPRLIFQPSSVLCGNIDGIDKENLDNYDKNYIGFMTDDFKQIYIRNIHNDYKIGKHLKFSIDKSEGLYSIKNKELTADIPNVVLAEGVFDIIVPYYSGFYKKILDIEPNYFFCIFGKSNYNMSIEKICKKLKSCVINCYILSDKDVITNIYEEIYRSNPYINKMSIYYNKAGKDFGDISFLGIENIIKLNIN